MSDKTPTEPDTTPTDLRDAGRALWASVADDYEMEEHESRLLHEACRTTDLLDELTERVTRDGAVIDTPQGLRAHPAAVEARQQRLVLGRLIAALRLPAGDEDDGTQAGARRPQRRSAFRGTYGIRGAVS